jgi:NTP pyrophosphatase (non-canonical NTP hydrolase)
MAITFNQVTAANLARAKRWHAGFPDDDTWSLADWCLAMVGEAGEAANIVKKLRRYDFNLRGVLDPPQETLKEMLAEELADTFIYLSLLAIKADINLPAAIVEKFNKVSDLQGFPERLYYETVPMEQVMSDGAHGHIS